MKESYDNRLSFSTIQYNTTVKRLVGRQSLDIGFSTIQYNTTVKQEKINIKLLFSFSTIQYNTTVKLFLSA